MSTRALSPDTKYAPSDRSHSAGQAKTLLADIREWTPGITARAAEIETARRIPTDIVDALKSVGVFRMFVPRLNAPHC